MELFLGACTVAFIGIVVMVLAVWIWEKDTTNISERRDAGMVYRQDSNICDECGEDGIMLEDEEGNIAIPIYMCYRCGRKWIVRDIEECEQ